MNELLSLADERVLVALWDATLKGTLLLGLAGVAALAARRASAATRHLLWSAALVGALLLPILSLLLPEWRVPWIPQWLGADSLMVSEREPSQRVEANVPAAPAVESDLRPAAPAVAEPLPVASPRPIIVVQPGISELAVSSAEVPSTAKPEIAPATVALAIWSIGLVISLTPLVIGIVLLARLSRRCPHCADPAWAVQTANAARQLGLSRAVSLQIGANVRSPLTWGAWRPVVLLPSSAKGWSAERSRVVLLHELAHVKRFDWLTQTLAYGTCSIYWFNPLAWWAARRMRVEREAACDDAVLAAGSRPADYADELLKLASAIMQRRLVDWAAVPMARRSTLEGRLLAILDGSRNRAALTRTLLIAAIILVVVVAVPIAMMRTGSNPSVGITLNRGAAIDLTTGQIVPREQAIREAMPYIAIKDVRPGPPSKPNIVKDILGPGRPALSVDWEVFGADVTFGSPDWTARDDIWSTVLIEPSGTDSFVLLGDVEERRPLVFQTRDGTRGILQIDEVDFNSIQVDFRRRAAKVDDRAQTTTTPVSNSDSKRFLATLPNGTMVEIIGISRNPSAGAPWWKADGTPLAKRPYVNERRAFQSVRGNRTAYEIAMRILSPPASDGGAIRTIVEGNSGSGTVTPTDEFGNRIDDISAESYLFDPTRASTNIKIGVALGPWKAALSGMKGGSIEEPHLAQMSDPVQIELGASVTVTEAVGWNEFATRFIAIDVSGKAHTPDDEKVNDVRQTPGRRVWTYRFDKDLPLAQIREFRYEYQPYQQVEFRNVSLQPGQNTEVQINTLAAKGAPGETEPEADPRGPQASTPNELQRKFVRIVIGPGALTFEGQSTTWEQLSELLGKVSDREKIVLELAVSSDTYNMGQIAELQTRAQLLARQFNFEYLSFIGVHPLGSKGTPAEQTPAAAPLNRAAMPEPAQLDPQLEARILKLIQGAKVSTKYQEIEVFELVPGSQSEYRIRGDLLRRRINALCEVFYFKDKNRFYVQWEEGGGASTYHYYGPFEGDPAVVLEFPVPAPEKPAQPLRERVERMIQGAKVTTKYPELEIFELVPDSQTEYRIRKDVARRAIFVEDDFIIPAGEVFYVKFENRFYIQWDGKGASTRHYYGPFKGEPADVLGFPVPAPQPLPEIDEVYLKMILDEAELVAIGTVAADPEELWSSYGWQRRVCEVKISKVLRGPDVTGKVFRVQIANSLLGGEPVFLPKEIKKGDVLALILKKSTDERESDWMTTNFGYSAMAAEPGMVTRLERLTAAAPVQSAQQLRQRIEKLIQGARITKNPEELEIYERVEHPTLPNMASLRLKDGVQQRRIPFDVAVGRSGSAGSVFYIPATNRFYLTWDLAPTAAELAKMDQQAARGGGQETFYGPFEGDPADVLGFAVPKPAGEPEETTAEQRAEAAAPWGEDVQGVSARLRADIGIETDQMVWRGSIFAPVRRPGIPTWTTRDVPEVWMWIRNQGERDLDIVAPQLAGELEYDGVWYTQEYDKSQTGASRLQPGSHGLGPIEVRLNSKWQAKEGGARLALTPGEHRVRLAFVARTRDGNEPTEVRILTNPVVLPILPAPADAASWGRTVNGLQAGLALQVVLRPYRIGEDVPVVYRLRNVGQTPITLEHDRVPVFVRNGQPVLERLFGPKGREIESIGEGGGAKRELPGRVTRALAPGEHCDLVTVLVPLRYSKDKVVQVNTKAFAVEPGTHHLFLSYEFGGSNAETWKGVVASDSLEIEVVAADAAIESGAPWEGAWGEPFDGVRCRLRSDKSQLALGESPILLIDLRSAGKGTIKQIWHGLAFRLEVDGKWLGRTAPDSVDGRVQYLEPGMEWLNIPAVLGGDYGHIQPESGEAGGRLDVAKMLPPGRHVVRVDVDGVVSNPVEVIVADSKEASSADAAAPPSIKPAIQPKMPQSEQRTRPDTPLDVLEFRGLDRDISEERLANHVKEHNLLVQRVLPDREHEGEVWYYVIRRDGEQIVVRFRDGKWIGSGFRARDMAGVRVLTAAWGKEERGLQLGLVQQSTKGECWPGDTVTLRLRLRSSGGQKVQISSNIAGDVEMPTLIDASGREISIPRTDQGPKVRMAPYLKTVDPDHFPAQLNDDITFIVPDLPAGDYKLRQRARVSIGREQIEFTSGDAPITIRPPRDWSAAVGGLQIFATAEKPVWRTDETPAFHLDLKNAGTQQLHYLNHAPSECRLKIDGQWYGWSAPITINMPARQLRPGEIATAAVTVPLSGPWAKPKNPGRWSPGIAEDWGEKLALKPGKHSIEIMFGPNLAAVSDSAGPITSAIEFTIMDAAAAPR